MTFFQNVRLGPRYPKMHLKPDLEPFLRVFSMFFVFSLEAALAADDAFKRAPCGLFLISSVNRRTKRARTFSILFDIFKLLVKFIRLQLLVIMYLLFGIKWYLLQLAPIPMVLMLIVINI